MLLDIHFFLDHCLVCLSLLAVKSLNSPFHIGAECGSLVEVRLASQFDR